MGEALIVEWELCLIYARHAGIMLDHASYIQQLCRHGPDTPTHRCIIVIFICCLILRIHLLRVTPVVKDCCTTSYTILRSIVYCLHHALQTVVVFITIWCTNSMSYASWENLHLTKCDMFTRYSLQRTAYIILYMIKFCFSDHPHAVDQIITVLLESFGKCLFACWGFSAGVLLGAHDFEIVRWASSASTAERKGSNTIPITTVTATSHPIHRESKAEHPLELSCLS